MAEGDKLPSHLGEGRTTCVDCLKLEEETGGEVICVHPADPSLPCDRCVARGMGDCIKICPRSLDGKLDLKYQIIIFAQHARDHGGLGLHHTQMLTCSVDRFIGELKPVFRWEQEYRQAMFQLEKKKEKIDYYLEKWNYHFENNSRMAKKMRDYIRGLKTAEEPSESTTAQLRKCQEELEKLRAESAKPKASNPKMKKALKNQQAETPDVESDLDMDS